MAKKDNTLLWIALGVGGYLLYEHIKAQNPANPVNNATVPNASGGLLMLPPSQATQNSAPAGASSSAPPVIQAGQPVNVTNLVPVGVNPVTAAPVLQPGQTLAVDSAGTPVTDNSGNMLAFPPPQMVKVILNKTSEPVVVQTPGGANTVMPGQPIAVQTTVGYSVVHPGQIVAVTDDSGGAVLDRSGNPLVYQPQTSDANYQKFIHGDYPGAHAMGDCA